jgi:4-amino-4-deoxychorismate lyase
MMLVNGHSEHCIDVSDRGLQYGDGLFETIKIQNGQPRFISQHYQRLQHGCARLLIPCPTLELLQAEIQALVNSETQGVVKIIITRGSGGRGYRQPEQLAPTRILSLHPLPDYPVAYQNQGITARFCQLRLGLSPALAGIKHLNRLEQVLARAEWQDFAAVQEGVLMDIHARVIEGTMSNLFMLKNHVLYTAPLNFSGVAGVVRNFILQQARAEGMDVQEQFFSQDFLLAADEIFFCNAIIGIWPVKQLAEQRYSVGPVAQYFRQCLENQA